MEAAGKPMSDVAELVGMVGVCAFLIAYFMLQTERLKANSAAYLLLNLAGALMVMFSLVFKWNLPAFLLEAAWALISIYGLYKHAWKRG